MARRLHTFEKKSSLSRPGALLRDALESRLADSWERTAPRSVAWLVRGGRLGLVAAYLHEGSVGRGNELGVADVALQLYFQSHWMDDRLASLPFVDEKSEMCGMFEHEGGVVRSIDTMEIEDEASAASAAESCVLILDEARDALASYDLDDPKDWLRILDAGGIRMSPYYAIPFRVLLHCEAGDTASAAAVLRAEIQHLEETAGSYHVNVSPELLKLIGDTPAKKANPTPDPRLAMYAAWLDSLGE